MRASVRLWRSVRWSAYEHANVLVTWYVASGGLRRTKEALTAEGTCLVSDRLHAEVAWSFGLGLRFDP
jgi:hypothetical protein